MHSHPIFVFALTLALFGRACFAAVYTDPKFISNNTYDFIVVGAGTAGCVIATRLTENPAVKVLVVEAGLSDNVTDTSVLRVPNFAGQGIKSAYDWNYTTTSQAGLYNRVVEFPRGYVVGGSSSINNMVYIRGASGYFDRFAREAGDSGWAWNNIQGYFHRNERHVDSWNHLNDTGKYNPAMHGNGPLLTSLTGTPSDLDFKVFQTVNDHPDLYKFNEDTNSGDGLGFGWIQSTVGNGARSSSSRAFLTPALGLRRNLDLLVQTHATKLVRTDAKSSEFLSVQLSQKKNGAVYTLKAKKEVIVSAGAIGSPQLLMVSGIGRSKDLKSVGINSLVDLQDVGYNLSDQPIATVQYEALEETLSAFFNNQTAVAEALELYAKTKGGILASNSIVNCISFHRLPDNSTILKKYGDPVDKGVPHIVIALLPLFIPNTDSQVPAAGTNWITAAVVVQSPTSRGFVKLASSSAFDYPVINPAYLTTDFDIQTMVEAYKIAQQFLKSSAFDGFVGKPFKDAAGINGDAAIEKYLRTWSITTKHPVGTCKVSKENEASGVVGPHLTVKKTKGLRVVDASVIPYSPAGYPQAHVYLLAERASDLIKADHKL